MTVKVQEKSSIRYVSLNRSETHNAFNPEMINEIREAFSKTNGVNAIVLSGEGKSFSAGADLTWMKSMTHFSFDENVSDSKKLYEMFDSIYRCPVPVIGKIHGNVFGGGVGLVAACDVVAALPETKFSFSEVKLGLVPAVISTFVLRKASQGFLRQMMLTAQTFSAEQARDAGLVQFVGAPEEVDDFIQSQLEFINSNGPEAVRATKYLLNYITENSRESSRDESIKTIAERRVSNEGQEGMSAFFLKRKPSWKS
jgi:methylglutaconyl-CoA hydratase